MTDQERKLSELIAKMDDSKGYVDNFDSFIDYCLFPFVANPSKELRQNFVDHYQDPTYQEAMLLLGEAEEDYHDCFGEVFMDRISHGAKGQFFTPEHIARLMAQITEPTNGGINDCACGSGRLLLAGLRHSRQNGIEPWIYAGDVDYRCCKMALLNLSLNSARGEVRQGNTLTADVLGVWHIDRLWLNGAYISWVWYYDKDTDMDALNAERQRQLEEIYCFGGFLDLERPTDAPREVQTEQPITEPVHEVAEIKNVQPLQLSLF